MKVCGLVAEFNPFHNGHVLYLEKAQELSQADIYILAMSPNFVQRGEPAIMDKERRTLAALDNGVDLVIEIPTIYTLQNADLYAKAALHMLEDLGADCVVFGTESGDTETFLQKFENKEFVSPRMDEIIQEYLAEGYSYPKAKAEASRIVNDFYLENPNDILGYSYLKIITQNKLKIKPLCYQRINNEKSIGRSGEYSSAMAIRNAIKVNRSLFDEHHFLDDYFNLLKYKIVTTKAKDLEKIHLVDEGIENLFKKNIVKARDMEDFINLCTSKRYSGARIKRTICHILLNTDKKDAKAILRKKPPYIRLLGSSPKGRKYLASIRKDTEANILTRFAAKDNPLLLSELIASEVYYLGSRSLEKHDYQLKELRNFPVKI